jgi:hypothetical protein
MAERGRGHAEGLRRFLSAEAWTALVSAKKGLSPDWSHAVIFVSIGENRFFIRCRNMNGIWRRVAKRPGAALVT